MRIPIALLVALGLVGCALADGDRLSLAPAERSEVNLPITIDQISYRAGGDRKRGLLMVTEEGIEFTTRKRTVFIPMDRIHIVSFGKMKGDVDTDWVVMAVGVAPPLDLVGLRDGRKMGFGRKTEELYDKLLAAVRKIGAAQYRVPQGFKAHDGAGGQCTLAIPENWNVYVQSRVVVGNQAPRGTTIFSEEPIRRPRISPDGQSGTVADPDALERALTGKAPAFVIESVEVGRGMLCKGLSERAIESVIERVNGDRLFGSGYEMLEPPSGVAATVGGCEGLHVVARARNPDGVVIVLEQFVVANNGTLYSFSLRAPAERLEEFRKSFDAAVATVKFAVDLR